MKKTVRTAAIYIFAALLAVFCLFSTAASSYMTVRADGLGGYDSTDVLEDLEGMIIYDEDTGEYKSFNIEDYAPNDYTQTDVLVFAEYMFPTYSANLDYFDLYVYVWNPQRISYELRSELNYVELGVSADGEYTTYNKYALTFLDVSEETGYSGVFIKYKVELSDSQKQEIYNTFTGEERYYHVAGLELLLDGGLNATDYDVNKEFIYSGYAAGCGADSEAESTLSFYQDVGKTLNLDVYSTAYRPGYDNGVNDYTQDSLHSVYFSVPNSVISEYGELYGVHARWLNAVLAPTLVIKQSVLDEYDGLEEQLYNYLGKDISDYYDDTDYAIVTVEPNGNSTRISDSQGYYFWYNRPSDDAIIYECSDLHLIGDSCIWWIQTDADTPYGHYPDYAIDGSNKPLNMADDNLEALYMYLVLDTDDFSDYTVPSGTLKARMLELTESVYSGSDKVAEKYAANLFSYVADEYTEIESTADDGISLTDKTYAGFWADLWDQITGDGNGFDYTDGEEISALYAVQASDMTGTDEEICENLRIGASEIEDFKAYYEEATANDETVYLFRYQVSDYEAIEGLICYRDSSDEDDWYHDRHLTETCYFFQETVNLDFDIIDVTFRDENMKLTTIAVIADPIDVIPEPTLPIGMDESTEVSWLTITILILVGIAGIVITEIVRYFIKKSKS